MNSSLFLGKGATLHKLSLVDALVRVVVLVVALVSLLLSLWIRSVVEGPKLADSVEHTAIVAVHRVPSVEHHLFIGCLTVSIRATGIINHYPVLSRGTCKKIS